MSDIADRAQWFEEVERAEAALLVVAQLTGPGRDDCARCGDEIPADRRTAMPAATHCLDCQERLERSARLHRAGGESFIFEGGQ